MRNAVFTFVPALQDKVLFLEHEINYASIESPNKSNINFNFKQKNPIQKHMNICSKT